MNQIVVNIVVALISLVGGYIIIAKTKLKETIKSKVDNDTYNLLKNICKDFCQYASDKMQDTTSMKDYANTMMSEFCKSHNIDISDDELNIIRHAVIEEAKKVMVA